MMTVADMGEAEAEITAAEAEAAMADIRVRVGSRIRTFLVHQFVT